MQVDLIIEARWIIPVEPETAIFEDHSLVIHYGKILEILPQQAARLKYQPATLKTLHQHALLPGFINAHTHTAMSLMRGIADDKPLMEWLTRHIWPLEQKWVGENFVRDGSMLAIAEMIRSGTTCFNDMYFFPDIVAQQAIQTGIRASIGLIVIDFATVWAENSEAYIEKGLTLYDTLRNETLISTAFAPHAPYTVSDEPLKKISLFADELNIPVHMHLHETRQEVMEQQQKTAQTPLQRLSQLGLLNPAFMGVHMTQLSENEIQHYAQTGAHLIHCPESNLKLASGFCPVAQCLDAGINVALGTDSAASNNDLDMLGEMRTAALLAKAVSLNAAAVPAMTALKMATLNGAKALGIDDKTGSLQTGKYADVIAINLDTLETQPLYDPVAQIVYSACRQQITDVWVAGKPLLKQRQLTTINTDELNTRVQHWQTRLQDNK